MFVITFIVYLITMRKYTYTEPAINKIAQVQTKTEKVNKATTQTETISEDSETETDRKTEESSVSTGDADTTSEDPVSEKSFKEQNAEKYADEIANADKTYLSDTTYISVKEDAVNDNTYWIAHIIVSNPEQLTTAITEEKRSGKATYDEDGYILALSGSNMLPDNDDFIEGLHICDYELISDTDVANGMELRFSKVGYLNTTEPGTTFAELNEKGTHWTVLTKQPTLIDNGKRLELSGDDATETTCKSAIGMVKPGEYYFMVASDGDYICDLTYKDMQEILYEKSCFVAQALSTGVNATLSMEGKLLNDPAEGSGRPQFEYIVVSDEN